MWSTAALATLAMVVAPAAEARLVAVISQKGVSDPVGIGQYDLRLVDALGGPTSGPADPALLLPDATNTVASEINPSLSADGRYLAFGRENGSQDDVGQQLGIPRRGVYLADRTRARNSPLALLQVIHAAGGGAALNGIDLSPNGRFATRLSGTSVGRYSLDQITFPFVTLTPFGSLVSRPTSVTGTSTSCTQIACFRGAALGPDSQAVWFWDDGIEYRAANGTGSFARYPVVPNISVRLLGGSFAPSYPGRIFGPYVSSGPGLFRYDLGWADFTRTPPKVERIDNLLADALPGLGLSQERQPRWSPDGRYLGFIQQTGTQQRLQMYDRETQTFVNDGVALGSREVDSWDLADTGITFSAVTLPTTTGLGAPVSIAANVSQATQIGILVQRITGTRRVLGRTVRRLEPVGRVPLGRRGRGVARFRWDGRVAGKRLAPGRYQVTMRSLTSGRVTDLARPVVMRVRAPGGR